MLAEAAFPTMLESPVSVSVAMRGSHISASAGDVVLRAHDCEFADEAIGLLAFEGALSTDEVTHP